MRSASRRVRADLTADALFPVVRATFDAVPDSRTGTSDISVGDALPSAFALFSLKDPSLLAFDHRRRDPNDNFRTVYGITKNDCERNATRRWLRAFRRDHPRLPVVIVEDDRAANAPHLRDLRAARAGYIITVQPGDHAFLFDALRADDAAARTSVVTTADADTGIVRHDRSHHGVSLNESNPDTRVSVLEYWEWSPAGDLQVFRWITDQSLTPDTVSDVMRGGRARWKIENETFNTLKNQGYHPDHNYGHGKKHLSVVLAMRMILALLVDQAQQIGCPVFRAAWAARGSKRSLWDHIRAVFRLFAVPSMGAILRVLADRPACPPLVPHNTA